MIYKLKDLFNIDELQQLCNNFTILSGVGTAILDLEGNILVASGWQPICTLFHRKNKDSARMCLESDTILAGQIAKGQKYNIYKCKNGLYDIAIPIIVENQHVGNFYTGQFLTEKPNEEYFIKQADEYNYDKTSYLESLAKVSIFTEDEIQKNVSFLVNLVQVIGNIGYTRVNYKNKLDEVVQEYAALNEEYKAQNEEIKQKYNEIIVVEEELRRANEELNAKNKKLTSVIFDLEKSKQDVLESEIRFKALHNASFGGISIHEKGKILECNQGLSEMTGFSIEELIGMDGLLLIAEASRDFVINKIITGAEAPYEAIGLKKNGDEYQMSLEARNIPYKGRQVRVVEFRDITEQKRIETEILKAKLKAEEGEKYTQMLFDYSPIGLALTSLSGQLLEVNKAYAEIIGYTINEILKLTYWDITPKIYEEQEVIQLENLTTNGIYGPYEKEYIHKSGKLIPVRLKGRIIERNGEKYIWSSIENISDKKNYELKLKQQNDDYASLAEEYKVQNEELFIANENVKKSKEYFKALIGKGNDVVTVINKQGESLFRSPSYKDVLGYALDEMKKGLFEKIHPEDRFRVLNEFKEFLPMLGKKQNFNYRYLHKNGTWRFIEGTGENMLNSPIVNGIVLNFRDVTERKKAEEELLLAKKKAEESDRLKTQFINNMSHEIRTPMNGIIGFSSFLNNEGLSHEKQKYFISIIQNSGNQLLRIIDDILEISKLGTKQVRIIEKEVCLNDLLLENFSVFDIKAKENKTPLYLKTGLNDLESVIITDEGKLNKILSNLLENSLKFTRNGFVEFGYNLKGNFIEIYVKDTGVGISSDKQEMIFERFSQEEKELSKTAGGLGLGLSIAKENVELLGGTIWVESKKNEGAVFYVSIPYTSVNQLSTGFVSNDDENVVNVLVVEDEEINYLYLETILQANLDLKIKVSHAKNGAEAVQLCSELDDIRLVLMDLKLPVMNGFEATEKIKMIYPDLPIVAQSAYTTSEDIEKAYFAGCDDFITKPIDKNVLSKMILKYLK